MLFNLLFDLAPEVTEAVEATAEGGTSTAIMPFFQILIGLYLVWAGLRGSGKIYANRSVKKEKAGKYIKNMRIFTLISGPLLALPGVFGLTGWVDGIAVFGIDLLTVVWAIGFISVIGMVVYTVICTDRTGKGVPVGGAESGEEAVRTAEERERDRLKAAFEFDDDDTANGGKKK